MTRTFVELPLFGSKWKTLGLDDDDLKRLQEEIRGIRKMRFAFEHRGKSGSVRVIYTLILKFMRKYIF